MYYSYKTPVAFAVLNTAGVEEELYVRKNEWGRTTGKHLKWIDGKTAKDARSSRMSGENFLRMFHNALVKRGMLPGEEIPLRPDSEVTDVANKENSNIPLTSLDEVIPLDVLEML